VRSEVTAERVARNQATFREANERIEAAAAKLGGLTAAPSLRERPQQDCTC
jgi:hypothetical protein